MKREKEKENKLHEVYNYNSDNKTLTQNVLWNIKNIDRDAAHNYNLHIRTFIYNFSVNKLFYFYI